MIRGVRGRGAQILADKRTNPQDNSWFQARSGPKINQNVQIVQTCPTSPEATDQALDAPDLRGIALAWPPGQQRAPHR